MLQLLRQRRLTASDRAEQVQNLFTLFQTLSGVAEKRHDLLDGFFHAVEIGKSRIALDDFIGKDARQTRIQTGVDQLGFAYGDKHTLRGTGVGRRILTADF